MIKSSEEWELESRKITMHLLSIHASVLQRRLNTKNDKDSKLYYRLRDDLKDISRRFDDLNRYKENNRLTLDKGYKQKMINDEIVDLNLRFDKFKKDFMILALAYS